MLETVDTRASATLDLRNVSLCTALLGALPSGSGFLFNRAAVVDMAHECGAAVDAQRGGHWLRAERARENITVLRVGRVLCVCACVRVRQVVRLAELVAAVLATEREVVDGAARREAAASADAVEFHGCAPRE